jgi:hypothetical protein
VQEPRAGELLRRAGMSLGADVCLDDLGDKGAVGDPKTEGKPVDKCQAAIKKAAIKFAVARLKSLEKCVDGVFTCVQTKPDLSDPSGQSPCLTLDKAREGCRKEFGKIDAAAITLLGGLQAKCGLVDYSLLASENGANLDALAGECASFGVATLGDLTAYGNCLLRQHACRVEEALRFEAPRADELLDMLTDPSLVLDSCPP